jgi:hypothetical protein
MKAAQVRSRARHHRDRQIEEVVHDPYVARSKPAGPAACPDCGLVFLRGRWQRPGRATAARAYVCPACCRIRERQPAGYVSLAGSFLEQHGDEILHLVRNEEKRESDRHPLQRIMGIERGEGKITLTTTDVHLARRIGDALASAFDGNLDVKYSRDECLVRIHWTR